MGNILEGPVLDVINFCWELKVEDLGVGSPQWGPGAKSRRGSGGRKLTHFNICETKHYFVSNLMQLGYIAETYARPTYFCGI